MRYDCFKMLEMRGWWWRAVFSQNQNFGCDLRMFNAVALGIIKSKTNQLVLSGCVLNGSDFSMAFVLSCDLGDNTHSM